jgi:murein tripeptide amidase MpaA
MVRVGEPGAGRLPVWLIARQHPGETMAGWFAEGLLRRLFERSDPVARACRERAVFYVVPNMNPDGAARGNLRTNAAGVDLNRQWEAPDAALAPEVLHVRARMIETGVTAFLDVHGDEALPYVFLDAPEELPGFDLAAAARLDAFRRNLRTASPDFQTARGYGKGGSTRVNLSIASKWVGHRFGALSATLELPFKDNADAPEPVTGWNGARSMRLAEATLVALLADLGSPQLGR